MDNGPGSVQPIEEGAVVSIAIVQRLDRCTTQMCAGEPNWLIQPRKSVSVLSDSAALVVAMTVPTESMRSQTVFHWNQRI